MTIVNNGSLLRRIQDLIGVSPSGMGGEVDIDLGSITQVLPVVPDIGRRGLAIATPDGWIQAVMQNNHAGADDETSNFMPYTAGAAAVGSMPPAVPEGWDIWLLGVTGSRNSGAGGLTGAILMVNPQDSSQGFGVDDAGLQIVASPAVIVAEFVEISELTTTGSDPMRAATGALWIPLNMRLPRAVTLTFKSTSAAAAVFDMILVMGIFPASLGQDVVA